MANTADTPHIGSDPIGPGGRRTVGAPHTLPTGTRGPTPDAVAAKLPRAANPDYYRTAAKSAADYVHAAGNNGMYVNNPTAVHGVEAGHPGTTAVFNQYTIDRDPADVLTRHGVRSEESNYGMTPGAARSYNVGLHVVGGDKPGTHYGLEPESVY